MPIPKIDQLRKDAEYLREHEVHRVFNDLAANLLHDRPNDVLDYIRVWATQRVQMQTSTAYNEDFDEDLDDVSHGPSTDEEGQDLSGSASCKAPDEPTGPPPITSVRVVSRQSSINLLRRAYPSHEPPETVQYPPDDEVFGTNDCEPPQPLGSDVPLNVSLSGGKRDWRPSPATLQSRFPSPIGAFAVGSLISSGHYGSVYRGIKLTTGELFAIKKVAIDGPWVISEYENLVHCTSDFVVQCEGCYYSTEEDMLWLVMEFLEHTVEHVLPNMNYLKEEYIAGMIEQTLFALREVHNRGRVHLDVKPANLLYNDEGHIKLGDFGTMAAIGEPCIQLGDFCFMAPEVAYSEGLFTDRSDIWSVGAVALTLADGSPPLCREDPKLLMYIHHETCMIPALCQPHRWSSDLRDFLSQCFVKDPCFRPSAEDLLKHPWIINYAIDPRSFGADKFQDVNRTLQPCLDPAGNDVAVPTGNVDTE